MFNVLIELLGNLSLFFALHVTGAGAFPRPLSEKDEKAYLQKAKNGDIEARNKLVEHNLRLVAHIVKKYYNSGTEQDDLVSIGTIGLIKAINTFDADKNIRLSSYASRCIENEVLMYFRNSKKTSQDIFLNDEIDSDSNGNTLTLMDVMCVEDSMIDDLDIKIKTEQLSKYINECLTPRERMIINLRYGLGGLSPLTQREVAKMLKISRSYVSRIEKKALSNLKKRYEKHNCQRM